MAITFCAASTIASPAQVFTTLHTFPPDGYEPLGGLVLDRFGSIYGTAAAGGDHNDGTVFTTTPNGASMTLHSFKGSDGSVPFGALLQASPGNFYGTTYSGGASGNCDGGCGTVFVVTDEGVLDTLHSFNGADGSAPSGALIQASDGNLYGTTQRGGPNANGTVFTITHSGALTILHSFNGDDGGGPEGGVIQASDGYLYGTTNGGGYNDAGTVFKMTLNGTLVWAASLLRQGAWPQAGLVQATDGNFYGTTYGRTGYGAIFKVTPSGIVTTLHVFDINHDGGESTAGLVQGSDGNFYGTTSQGGADGFGTVFKVTYGGTLTTLHSFNWGGDGGNPRGGLVQGRDGTLYGATWSGGAGGGGTVFSLTTAGFIGTTTTLTSTPNPSYIDQTVTMIATVQAQNGSLPVGTVYFQSDGVELGAVALNNSGVAVLTYFGLPAGTDSLLAIYEGGNGYGGSASNPVNQVVNPRSSTTAATSAPNPSADGQPVTITASVSPSGPPSPTGTVDFASNGATITGCTAITLMSGQAICNTTSLAVGMDAIVATYSGDNNYLGSSGMVSQSVDSHLYTTTGVMSSPNPSIFGQQVTITAGVGSPLGGEPTGTVNFASNGNAIPGCTGVSLISQTATCMTSGLAVGTDTIVATYSGDNVYAPSSGINSQLVNPVPMPLQFVAAAPCRLIDTRDGSPIEGNTSQSFVVPQLGGCGIPASAAAYSLNVTVVPQGQLEYLTIWPTGEGQPYVSTMNSLDGRFKANAAIVPAGDQGAVSIYVTNTSDVVLDINGYFVPLAQGTLQFYPLTPCRVVDTRRTDFPSGLGAPSFGDMEVRELPVLANSPCLQGLPNMPQAYSFNVTVVPNPAGQPLNYLTIWPSDQPQPNVSTLNNPTATVVANAAIVPVGHTNSDVSVFTYNSTDVIIDINGYFARPGSGGYSFYPVAPCRVLDTRDNNGQPFQGGRPVNVVASRCAPPSSATSYVFNATVVPSGFLDYLTLWPDGQQQPTASTLNAYDGLITSNMAIVPTSDGFIDAYASQLTHLILDISGYFAP